MPRGAGLSYTAGAVPHAPAIAFDMMRMNAIETFPGDLAVVGLSGCRGHSGGCDGANDSGVGCQ